MKNVITYVGIDAHKKDLFMAMLVGHDATPVTWTTPNEPSAVRRLVRKLEREAPGAVHAVLRSRPVWLRVAAAGDHGACELRRGCAGADSAETG